MKHIDEMIHLIVIVVLFYIPLSVELLQQPDSYKTNHSSDYSYRNTYQPALFKSLRKAFGINNGDDTDKLFSSSKQSFQVTLQSESHIIYSTLLETSNFFVLRSRSPPCTLDLY